MAIADVAEQIAESAALTPGGARLLQTTRQGVNERRWDWTDAICQKYRNWTPGDYWCFAQVQSLIFTGTIGVVRLEVGDRPSRDKEREANARALSQAADPFVLRLNMTQNNSPDGDGWASWTEPITVDQWHAVGGELLKTRYVVDRCRDDEPFAQHSIALEVGSTSAVTTFMHLAHGGVMRWPYDSTEAWGLITLDSSVLAGRVAIDMASPEEDPPIPAPPAPESLGEPLSAYLHRLADEGPTCDDDRMVLALVERLRPRAATE